MRVKITDGRFVGDYARELVSVVGMWIRKPEHYPINLEDYDEIDAEYKTRLRQLIKVIGEDRHGRVRGEGAGICKTAYYERRGREGKLQAQLEEAHKKIDEQANDIILMKEQLKKLMAHVAGQTSEDDVHGSNENAHDV